MNGTIAGIDIATLPPEVQELVKGGGVLKALGADPKYRGRVLEIIKDASPDTPIPELDLQRDLDSRVTARVKPVEDDNKALRDEVAGLKARLSRDDLRSKHDLSEADLVEIEELKTKGGIANDETAIEHHRMRMALSAPRPTVEPGTEAFQQKLRKINPRHFKKLEAAATEEGHRVLREMRGRRYA